MISPASPTLWGGGWPLLLMSSVSPSQWGAPFFAQFAKSGNQKCLRCWGLIYGCSKAMRTARHDMQSSTGVSVSRPCKQRKDGAATFRIDKTSRRKRKGWATRLPGPTPKVLTLDLSASAQGDRQAYGHTYPTCLASNENQALDMSWTVTVGSTIYPVDTIVHITKGNFSGTLTVTSTITTP